jgi:2-methylcitrate dehydratase PrpD
MANWVSPRLGIRFDISGQELEIYHPDGIKFFSYTEANQIAQQQRQRAEEANQQLEEANQIAQQERLKSQLLQERLEQMGINFEDLS